MLINTLQTGQRVARQTGDRQYMFSQSSNYVQFVTTIRKYKYTESDVN